MMNAMIAFLAARLVWATVTFSALLVRAGEAPIVSCWVGGFSREYCCHESHGPQGNPQCWDDIFTYDPCCTETYEPSPVGEDLSSDFAPRLERSLGAKLDESMAETGRSLEEVEADLRQTIAPENRTMGEQTTLAFLALVLKRMGRVSEAEAELRKISALSSDFSISSSGAWVGAAAAGSHMHDKSFSAALMAFFRDRNARSIVDFGCGLGLYVRDLRMAGFRAGGFDGNPSTSEISEGRCQQADLSRDLDFGTRWDWLMSLEVAEHIPREFEAAFLENLERHACAGMVLSWGNQAGEGHVNLRETAEVEQLFAARGFRRVELSTATLQNSASLPWLQHTVIVLERERPLLGDGCCAGS